MLTEKMKKFQQGLKKFLSECSINQPELVTQRLQRGMELLSGISVVGQFEFFQINENNLCAEYWPPRTTEQGRTTEKSPEFLNLIFFSVALCFAISLWFSAAVFILKLTHYQKLFPAVLLKYTP